MDIDFVVTWVDDSDPKWLIEKDKYLKCATKTNIDSNNCRYKDWDLLKYWFRGIERYAPWIRYIHFVTYGHLPKWLDLNNPKLKIVRHEDFIPHEYLPLFNSNAIELMMHRIPDLSEHFVYFNDDFYLISPILPTYFFKNGKPCDIAVAKDHHSMEGIMQSIIRQNMTLLNKEFNLFSCMCKHPLIWFNCRYKGFLKLTFNAIKQRKIISLLDTHAPQPYIKSIINRVWSKHYSALNVTLGHRFRSGEDISHWLFRYWQIAEGNINPCNIFSKTKVFYGFTSRENEVADAILSKRYSVVILNDNNDEVLDGIGHIVETFDSILPDKSSFEK